MRTLIIWVKQGFAGSTPSILKASRIMKKLESKGSIARFGVARCSDTEEDAVVICEDFKGSDYEVNALQREFSADIFMDFMNHHLVYQNGKWNKTDLFWTTNHRPEEPIFTEYRMINGITKYLVDTPF